MITSSGKREMFSGALQQKKGILKRNIFGLLLGIGFTGLGLYVLRSAIEDFADLKFNTIYNTVRGLFAVGMAVFVISVLLIVGVTVVIGAVSGLKHARRLARTPQLEPLIDVAQLDDAGITQLSGAHIPWSDIVDIRTIHGHAHNGHAFHELLLQPDKTPPRAVIWGGQKDRAFGTANLGERLYARWRSPRAAVD